MRLVKWLGRIYVFEDQHVHDCLDLLYDLHIQQFLKRSSTTQWKPNQTVHHRPPWRRRRGSWYELPRLDLSIPESVEYLYGHGN